MKLKKFNELDFFLENYIIDLKQSDVISKNKNISIVKKTQRGHKICKLYRNGVCSVYTLADLLAYKAGILNKKNYNLNVKLVEKNNYTIENLNLVTLSEQNKISNVGKNLITFWKNKKYCNRDREYTYKYDYLTRCKIYKYKTTNKMTNSEISKKLNIPKCTIGRILKEFYFVPKEESRKALWTDKHLTEQDKQTILILHKNKIEIKDICNIFKIPPKIAKSIIKAEWW